MMLTVVIPVRGRPHLLGRVLEALAAQERNVPHRVVVVDDGSPEAVASGLAHRFSSTYLSILRTPPRGRGAARNAGARSATTPLILFLGGDILPDRHLLERHQGVHRLFPQSEVGCVGMVTWDPALPPTPFMVFLEHGGPQNAYGEIAGATWVAPRQYCYGSNLSLKKDVLDRVGGFDETHFHEYGWEDLDLGIRLEQHGFRLYYEPAAKGFHIHHITLKDAAQRMVEVGRGARTLHRLHPDVGVVDEPSERWKRPLRRWSFSSPVRQTLLHVAERWEKRWVVPRLYRRVLSLAFYDGVHGQGSVLEK